MNTPFYLNRRPEIRNSRRSATRKYRRAKKIQTKYSRLRFAQHETSRAHSLVISYATYSPWLDDSEFQMVYQKIASHTLKDIHRLYELYILANQVSDVEGDFIEVGVWRGGSGAFLGIIANKFDKKTYLADTFTGVVKSNDLDSYYSNSEHNDTNIDYVNSLLSKFALKDVYLLKGVFPEETALLLNVRKLAFVHIDVDVYQSAKDVWDYVLPFLSIGAVVVLNDYLDLV
jgi:O-methyltransferase